MRVCGPSSRQRRRGSNASDGRAQAWRRHPLDARVDLSLALDHVSAEEANERRDVARPLPHGRHQQRREERLQLSVSRGRVSATPRKTADERLGGASE
eukprot:5644863-Pleurochrysis_carterae.AAC.1